MRRLGDKGAAKSDGLADPVVEGEIRVLQIILWTPHARRGTRMNTHTHAHGHANIQCNN